MHSLKEDNGIFSYELNSAWEYALADVVNLGVESGISGANINFAVVDKYCDEYDVQMGAIEMFGHAKHVCSEVFSKNED